MNWIDPWGLCKGEKRENEYEKSVETTRIRYFNWIPSEGEGLLGSYTFDVYTSIKETRDSYTVDIWVVAVSGPHIRHDDTRYFGSISLNVDGQEQESKSLEYPKDSFLIENTSSMVGETNFQLPPRGDVSITIKDTGYMYNNPEGVQFSYPSRSVEIDIKEKK